MLPAWIIDELMKRRQQQQEEQRIPAAPHPPQEDQPKDYDNEQTTRNYRCAGRADCAS